MKLKKKMIWTSSRTFFVLMFVSLPLGCSNEKIPQGKYTEEQMQTIPMANRYDLPEPTGGMVFSIDSETLDVDNILAPVEEKLRPLAQQGNPAIFKNQAMPMIRQIVRGQVSDLLLYQEAKKNAPEQLDDLVNNAVEKEIDRFVANYGNDLALAEGALKELGMDWRSFRDFQKKMILTQSYVSSAMEEEKKFSREELLDYYNSIRNTEYSKPGKVEFRLIDISVESLKSEQIQEGESPPAAARRIAEEILAWFDEGRDFAELAKEHSHGPLASIGGLWRPVTIGAGSLAKPYDILEQEAIQILPGQIAGPIESEDQKHVFVLKVESRQLAEITPFEDVQYQIESLLMLQFRQEQYYKVVEKVLKKADFVEMERFSDFCADEAYRRWR